MNRHLLAAVSIAAAAVVGTVATATAATINPGPLPSAFAGGFLDTDVDMVNAELQFHKEAAKLAHKVNKCFSKGAKNVWRGKPDGIDFCIHNSKKGALAKFHAKVDTLPNLPDCLKPTTLLGQKIVDLTRGLNPEFYCGSPSGAFLDRATLWP